MRVLSMGFTYLMGMVIYTSVNIHKRWKNTHKRKKEQTKQENLTE